MQVIDLYRYVRESGGVTISPIKPDCECSEMFRLVADEGKLITNGEIETFCIDVHDTEGWTEIDAPEETEPEPEP